MELRYYQKNAVQAVLDALQKTALNPCLEIPTGGGKTPIIATLARVLAEAGARVLIVAHRKELVEQTADKLGSWANGIPFSIVSAGLGERDYSGRVVVAGIQSVYKHSQELSGSGQPINFLIVDEAHLIPNTDLAEVKGMYQTLISELRAYYHKLRVIGLTATPYRLGSGSVVGDDKILNKIVYKVGVGELIEKGFLSKLRSRLPELPVDLSKVHIERGEFKTAELDDVYGDNEIIFTTVKNIIAMTKNRKSVLVFCCSVKHAELVANALRKESGEEVGLVTGSTPSDDRAELLRRFKGDTKSGLFGDNERALKYLVNVDVLTTGFDATNVDTVVLLRPTMSAGLFYQMVGRGFRINPKKEDCLILDFAGNIERHGAVDKITPPEAREKGIAKVKKCPRCLSAIAVNAKICPECGAVIVNEDFECPKCSGLNDKRASFCMYCGYQLRAIAKHDTNNQTTGVIISTEEIPPQRERITSIVYQQHTSRASGKNSLRVSYTTELGTRLSEFVCFEHEGFALQKALKWWTARSNITPAPRSVEQAFYLADGGYIGEPTYLTYKPKTPESKYPELISVEVEQKDMRSKPYPHTDNPLGLACQSCGATSFIYLNPSYGVYQIKCAKCGAVFGEFTADNCDGAEGLKGELASHYRAGIEYYNPNKSDEEFFVDDDKTDALGELKDIFGGSLEDDIPF